MSESFDLLIRGGTIVDGSGAPGRAGDVAIRGGRVAALGEVKGSATSQPLTPGPQRRPARLAAPISVGVRMSLRARVSRGNPREGSYLCFWTSTMSPML